MGHPIETLFSRLKDWRRIATGYGRWAQVFGFAIFLAAIIIF